MIAAGLALLLGAPALPGTPENGTVTLMDQGRSDWKIVCPSKGRPGVPFAIGELVRYLDALGGVRIPVVESAPAGPALVIGLRADLSEEDRRALPDPARGHDGFALLVRAARDQQPARVIVAGESGRAVIYGVYEVLERLGCRWYVPALDPEDPEVVPRRSALILEAGSRTTASPLRFRIANPSAWFFDVDPRAAAAQLDWAMKNRYNAIGWQCDHRSPAASQYGGLEAAGLLAELERRDLLLHGPGHCFDQFLRAEEHLADHPEWFGLRDGKRVGQNFLGAQFCWSDAGARRQFAQNLEAFVRACPRIRILCIVPFDGGVVCACPRCAKEGPANLLMKLLGEVIDRLQAVDPSLLVETVGGYPPVEEPPAGVPIHPRQRIIWAHWGRHLDLGSDDVRYGRKANLETWRKASPGGLTVCQYYTDNFAEPWILPPFTTAMAGDRRHFIQSGIDSVYVLMWSKGFWWNHALNGHLAGRLFYDASLDPAAAVRDYAMGYFGAKAGPLLAADLLEWASDVDLAYRIRDGATEGDRERLARQRREWIDPAAAAVRDDPVLRHRVGKLEMLHALAEKLCEVHILRSAVRRAREAKDLQSARELLAKAKPLAESVLGNFHTLAGLGQGLIDKDDISWIITLRVKGWIDEEEKLLAASEGR